MDSLPREGSRHVGDELVPFDDHHGDEAWLPGRRVGSISACRFDIGNAQVIGDP
jgi:hypothetical protein